MKTKLILLFFLCNHSSLFAQEGTIDSTFGNNGVLKFDVKDDNYVNDLLFGDDYSFITAGRYYQRNATPYTPHLYFSKHFKNETIDPGFGTNGIIDSLTRNTGFIYKMKLLPNGNILASDVIQRSKLVCLNQQGQLINSFGVNGIAEADNTTAFDVFPDGKIITAGTYYDGINGYFHLSRFNDNGSIDSTFGNNGSINYDVSADRYEYVSEVSMQHDNKFLVAGGAFNVGNGVEEKAIIARFNPDGSKDATFGNNGIAIISVGDAGGYATFKSMTIQSDGKILLGGTADMNFPGNYVSGRAFIIRLKTDGGLDTSFAINGILIPGDFYSAHRDIISIEQLPDKKIIAVGYMFQATPETFGTCIMLDSSGNFDLNFGSGGVLETSSNYTHVSYFSKVKMRSDGKIFLAGGSWDNDTSHRESIVLMCLKKKYKKEIADSEINIYPNPSNGDFIISGIETNNTLKIFSLLGQEMNFHKIEFDENKTRLEAKLSAGIYFVTIYGKVTVTKKIIIY